MSKLLNLNYNVEDYLNNDPKLGTNLLKLKDKIATDPIIPKNLTDAQLVLFLLACFQELDDTAKCIHEYYQCRKNGPELFNNRETNAKDIRSQLKALEYVVLPKDTPDGHRMIFHRLYDTTPSSYVMDVAMKILFMSLDSALYRGPPKGLIILFDMRGVGLMHLTRVKLGAVRKFFQYLQYSIPVRLHQIHVFNCVYFMDKVLAIIKPFMKKELWDMLHLHPTSLDMDKFYEEFIPKDLLPSDFGGDLPSVQELHQKHCKELETLVPYFIEEEQQRNETTKDKIDIKSYELELD